METRYLVLPRPSQPRIWGLVSYLSRSQIISPLCTIHTTGYSETARVSITIRTHTTHSPNQVHAILRDLGKTSEAARHLSVSPPRDTQVSRGRRWGGSWCVCTCVLKSDYDFRQLYVRGFHEIWLRLRFTRVTPCDNAV